MKIFNYLKEDIAVFGVEVTDWRQAISSAGEILEKKEYINHEYTLDMINTVEKNGSYIVAMPKIAFAHARPNGNVAKNSISLLTLKNGINFGHSTNDPVEVVFAIAAISDDEHLELFKSVAEFLMIEENVDILLNAKKYSDLI